jgi:hypothetical protein
MVFKRIDVWNATGMEEEEEEMVASRMHESRNIDITVKDA